MSSASGNEIRELFESATDIDPDLRLPPRSTGALSRLRIRPTSWRRAHLFHNMSCGRPSLYNDFPAPLFKKGRSRPERLLEAIAHAEVDYRIRTRVGQQRSWRYFTPEELIQRWLKGRSQINVTDFHFINSGVDDVINHRVLSDFNLLPLMPESVSWIEMMTLVISSRGGFSDSHSDDCDGSNHCFTGTKLWLAWDTAEGLAAGLEDLDQQRINGKCAFDMDTFLSLKSACWFTVEPEQTLFMPGHCTHKVITLAPYLGVGSFYIAYPNILRTLARWQEQRPNWERLEGRALRESVYRESVDTAVRKLHQIKKTTPHNYQKWGAHILGPAWHQLKRQATPEQVKHLCDAGGIGRLLNAAGIY